MATDVNPSRPSGRDEILDAVLDAADRLMSERGPEVSLRAIAEAAGVSYSLVHRHVGTKEALIDRLLQRYAERWSATLADDPDFGRALDRLLDAPGQGPGSYLRLLSWVLLSGSEGQAQAHRRHARLVDVASLRGPEAGSVEAPRSDEPSLAARVDVAMALALIFGWRFFEPYLVAAMHLDEVEPAELHRLLRSRMRDLAGLVD